MKHILLLMVFLIIVSAPDCRAEKLLVYQNGSSSIYGSLPNTWKVMTREEISGLAGMKEKLDSPNLDFLAGYRFATFENVNAMLFVFYVNQPEKVTWEQRQKMFNWFKKNKVMMEGLLPDNIKEFTLENIEYLQNKDTLVFESMVKVDDMDLKGVNGIVFLRKGYLNIFGYVAGGSTQQLADCYSFIKNLDISPDLQYADKKDAVFDDYRWLQGHWQQILGVTIFLMVYGIIFLHRDKNRLVV
jgi:hypothetical protein